MGVDRVEVCGAPRLLVVPACSLYDQCDVPTPELEPVTAPKGGSGRDARDVQGNRYER